MDEDALFEEIRDLYSREGIDGVLGVEGLRSMAGCRALADLGVEIRSVDPHEGAACMVCADLLASQLQPGELGERELEDFRCEMALDLVWSWMDLKRTADAEEAFARAAWCLSKGTRNPALKGKLLDTWAVLHGTRGDFDKARQAAQAALALYEQTGERHDQGRILLRMSIIEDGGIGEGKKEASLQLVNAALSRLDAAAEPDLYLTAVHRQAICLVDLGRFREARVRLFESLGHLREHGHEGHDILRSTLNGQINVGIGNLDAAERDLFDGLLGFWRAGAGLGYVFGLLALDLCAVYYDQGRHEEARAGGLKIVEVFRSLSLPAGGQKAMLFLEMALEDGHADSDLLRRASRYMQELLNDPDARFRPRA